jgi:hypothetical protein
VQILLNDAPSAVSVEPSPVLGSHLLFSCPVDPVYTGWRELFSMGVCFVSSKEMSCIADYLSSDSRKVTCLCVCEQRNDLMT